MTRETHQRGVALLLVLAALVLTVSAASLTARAAATRTLCLAMDAREAMADDLPAHANAAIELWLEESAGKVVLPPDAATPEVAVLADRWEAEAGEVSITITAWDQCGMVPRTLAGKGGFAVVAVPEGVAWLDAAAPGIDLFEGAGSASPLRGGAAPGAMVATHNPPPLASPREATIPAINVHTAPRKVLAAAYRHVGLSGEELVLVARGKGERAAVPRRPSGRHADGPRDLDLSATSNAWAFRVDATVAGLRRSWWCVYVRRGDRWILEQRLALT